MLSPFRGLRFARLELDNIKASRMMHIVIAAIAIIPLLYGALYLCAFFDPYKTLNDVPIAVVNEDVGATINGESLNAGDDIVETLKDTDDGLQWNFVSEQEAQEGLENGDYFMTLTIPEDFSECVASADSDDPQQAILQLEKNESVNMLASQIGSTVIDKIQAAVTTSVSAQYYDNIFTQIDNAVESIETAAEGAAELSDGLVTAQTGSATITTGLESATSGATSLSSGLTTLAEGANTANSGATSLASGAATVDSNLQTIGTGASSLAKGTASLMAGTAQLSGSIGTLTDANSQDLSSGVANLATATTGLSTQTATLNAGTQAVNNAINGSSNSIAAVLANSALTDSQKVYYINAILNTADATTGYTVSQVAAATAHATTTLAASAPMLEQGLASLNTAVNVGSGTTPSLVTASSSLYAGAQTVNSGAQTLASGVAALQAQGTSSLASGASQLASGTSALASGASSAASGTVSLVDGLSQLSEGSSSLTAGITTAQEGSSELASGLSDGADKISMSDDEIDAKVDMMSEPVDTEESLYTEVPNYGTGFAPYFIALGLWVGALMLSFVFKPYNGRIVASNASAGVAVWAGYLPMACVAIVQALLLGLVLQFALRISILHVAAFYALIILTALVFAAIIQMLTAAFGFPGKFIAIIVLMLQLTSAAGTFPIETTPEFFQVVSPWLPMTYVVAGLRECLTGLNMAHALSCAGILAAFGIACIAITALVIQKKRTVRMEDIHPLLNL